MNDNHYLLNEDTYVDLVCLDDDNTKKIMNWLRAKGCGSHEIIINAVHAFGCLTTLTDEEKKQLGEVLLKAGERFAKEIEKEQDNDRTRNY